MKLAEALAERADIIRRLDHLRGRMTAHVYVQEGTTPPEDPNALLRQFDDLAATLTDLIRRINHTNSVTPFAAPATDGTVDPGQPATVTDALALRDTLRLRTAATRQLADAAQAPQSRYSLREIAWVPTVDPAALQQRADDLAREQRLLDLRIQELNWSVELLEESGKP